MKEHFLLDPSVVFLNHGSFGACPRPVFEAYQNWQRRLECQPVLFLGREFPALDRQAREVLGSYLQTSPDHLAFIPNATFGVNAAARSLNLSTGDEILTTNHEYGACDNTWNYICRQNGATIIRQPVRLPVQDADQIVEQFWEAVTPRTRVIYLSHITSSTALRLPVEMICQRARQSGIWTIVDGAHAPGQIPLNLVEIGADFYLGNCHKWMLSPKGAGFFYAHPEVQDLVEPLVVSWGYCSTPETTTGSQFLDRYQWTGTRDPAAALSVPAATQFMDEHNWNDVRKGCHVLLGKALGRLCELVGMEPPYPLDSDFFIQMGIAPLPAETDLAQLKDRLYGDFQVEVPLIEWEGHKFVRISVQAYNTEADLDILYNALKSLLPEVSGWGKHR